jgi:RNA recognition motif-containing protein
VFCGNLSFNTTTENLKTLFGEHGKVNEVRIAQDQDGRSRGFAHIEFEDPAEAASAV